MCFKVLVNYYFVIDLNPRYIAIALADIRQMAKSFFIISLAGESVLFFSCFSSVFSSVFWLSFVDKVVVGSKFVAILIAAFGFTIFSPVIFICGSSFSIRI